MPTLDILGLSISAGATRIAAMLNTAVNDQYDSAYLCFSSLGGYVADGIFLYHHLRSLPMHVVIHNTGTVASIATTLFVAGHRRLCAPHSIFMMHPVTVGSGGNMASAPLQAALDAALNSAALLETDRNSRFARTRARPGRCIPRCPVCRTYSQSTGSTDRISRLAPAREVFIGSRLRYSRYAIIRATAAAP